jgi:hypothetical protein
MPRSIAAQGGEVHLLGKAELRIPPGALAADTVIEIRKLEVGAPYAQKTGLLSGSVIQLEPSGLVFQTPAQLSVFYDPAQIPAGLAPQNLTLVSHNRGEAWQEHPSVVSTSPFTITASVSHFTDWAGATQASKIGSLGRSMGARRASNLPAGHWRCPTARSGLRLWALDSTTNLAAVAGLWTLWIQAHAGASHRR